MSEHPSTPAPRRPLTPRERRERRRIRRRRLLIRRCLIVLVGVLLVLAIVGILSGIVRLASGGGQSAGGLTDSQPASSAQSAPPAALSFAGVETAPLQVQTEGLSGYQALYPDLYVPAVPGQWKSPVTKTVYLTFDGGPGEQTQQLLDALAAENVKATFFLSNRDPQAAPMIRAIYEAGHVCAVGPSSEDAETLFASVDAYLDDFYAMWQLIQAQTGGHCAPFFRFPGGSDSTQGGSEIRAAVQREMLRRGFYYYDWDIDSGDTAGNSGTQIYAAVTGGMSRDGNMPVFHETAAAVEQLPRILAYGEENGYTFLPLDGTLDPSTFLREGVGRETFFSTVAGNPNFTLSDENQTRFADRLQVSSAGPSTAASA